MVRVLAIADEEVPGARSRARSLDVDLLLSAGDLPWWYAEEIAAELGVPAAGVPGNHDPEGDGPRGFIGLDRRVAEVAGLRLAGLGGCVRYNGESPHQHTQETFRRDAERLMRDAGGPVDVLVTHAPPSGLGDEPDPAHVGVEALHDVIAALTPSWHLHGHIHPYGRHLPDRELNGTTIRNVIPWTVLEVVPRSREEPDDDA